MPSGPPPLWAASYFVEKKGLIWLITYTRPKVLRFILSAQRWLHIYGKCGHQHLAEISFYCGGGVWGEGRGRLSSQFRYLRWWGHIVHARGENGVELLVQNEPNLSTWEASINMTTKWTEASQYIRISFLLLFVLWGDF